MFSLYERKHFQPELSDFAFILGPIHAGKKALCRSKNTRKREGGGRMGKRRGEYEEKERNNLSKDEEEEERETNGVDCERRGDC